MDWHQLWISLPPFLQFLIVDVLTTYLLVLRFDLRRWYALIPGSGIVIMFRELDKLPVNSDDFINPFRNSVLSLWLCPLVNAAIMVWVLAWPDSFADLSRAPYPSHGGVANLKALLFTPMGFLFLVKSSFWFSSFFFSDLTSDGRIENREQKKDLSRTTSDGGNVGNPAETPTVPAGLNTPPSMLPNVLFDLDRRELALDISILIKAYRNSVSYERSVDKLLKEAERVAAVGNSEQFRNIVVALPLQVAMLIKKLELRTLGWYLKDLGL